jgi:hypothetical protein
VDTRSDPRSTDQSLRVARQVAVLCRSEGGPSVSQNTEEGTLTITFALDAKDAKDALERAGEIFAEGANATELAPSEVLDVEASVVRVEEADDTAEREPVPA